MTVKELITRLLDENMDSEILLQTHDAKIENEEAVSGVLFHVDDVEHHEAMVFLNFVDWRE